MAYQLGQQDEAISLIESTLEQTTGKIEQARLKLKLADIYLHEDEVWEATLLYSQVDKSMKEEPLGHEARFKTHNCAISSANLPGRRCNSMY